MGKIFIMVFFVFTIMACDSRQELYRNDAFAIFRDNVLQGKHNAVVISGTEIKSNYSSDYRMPTRKVLDFKFAMNGFDNERYPGEDHHLVMVPEKGRQISPVYRFGKSDPAEALYDEMLRNDYLQGDVAVTIRCDMRDVLRDFKDQGYFILYNGEKLKAGDFKGVFVAGSTLPLTWDFANLSNQPQFQLQDADGDSIYDVTIHISKFQTVDPTEFSNHWVLAKDVGELPRFTSDIPLINALYNMSLEEVLLDVREDQSFMAGAKWPGVWTRDISYSIIYLWRQFCRKFQEIP